MTRLLPETRTVSQAAARAGTITAVLVVAILAALLIVPAFALLHTSTRRVYLLRKGPTRQTEVTHA